MPEITVINGVVLFRKGLNVSPVTAKELLEFTFRRSGIRDTAHIDIMLSDVFERIKVRRKPAKIVYEPSTELGSLKICVVANNLHLNQTQVQSLTEYGYYISQNRLHTALEEDISIVRLVSREDKLNEQLKAIAALRTEGRISGNAENLVDGLLRSSESPLAVESSGLFKHRLYPYQRYGVNWLLHCCVNNLGTILGDDMGLGKTAQIIALIAEAFQYEILERVMVVVPNSLLENWRREFEFFCPSIIPYFHYGDSRTGLAENLEKYKVVIMPYTVMSSDIEMLVDLDVSLLVFDEASLLKNPDSARSVAATRMNANSKIAMTGTPVENNLLDVWSISNIVYPGYLGSKELFTERYIEQNIQATLESDLTGLEASISQIMLRRMKKDILDDLPEKIDIHHPVLMLRGERAEYNEIVSDIRSSSDERGSILAEITKLQKFTAHPSLIDGDSSPVSFHQLIKRSAKLERLFELLAEILARSEKVLIFANHHAAIDLLVSSIKKTFQVPVFNIDGRVEVAERQNVIDNFSCVLGFSALVLNPKTAGMGLNITAASHVIHYSRQWNPALEEQATARSFRNGQTKDVNVYYLYYVDTIEEIIDERLRLKKELADNVVTVVDNKNSEIEFYIENI